MARVNKQLQQVLAELVPGRIKDPRAHAAAMVTVVEVRTTPDLRHAKVYLSVLGEQGQRQPALEAIEGAAGFLRMELGRKVRLRYTPELHFTLDESLDSAARIDRILDEIAAEGYSEQNEADGDGDDDSAGEPEDGE